MIMSPLELAVAISEKKRDPEDPADRNERSLDAQALADTGMFSVPHIIAIVDLPRSYAYQLLAGANPHKFGGKLNVEHLKLINDVAFNWRQHRVVRKSDIHEIVAGGTSPRMLSRLSGIHYNTIYRWLNEAKPQPLVAPQTPN